MDYHRDNLADEWPPLRTLTDIALRHWNVKLTCAKCDHIRVLSVPGLWYLFYCKGWNDHVAKVKTRMVCSPCLVTKRIKIAPWLDKTRGTTTGPQPLDPGDYEWKKLIARYRS